MEIKNYKNRLLDESMEKYLKLFGAVVIEGPKYCGKTWMGRKHAKSEVFLQSKIGEESNLVEIAKMSPTTILHGEKPKLIDEWQEATNLWDEIRMDVDKEGEKGQYILTGSSTPNRENISHSGAGRFGKIHLRTMSLYESGDSSGMVSLKDICEGKKVALSTGKVELEKLAYLIIRGGWPANLNYTVEESKKMVEEYINLIIDDDLYRLDGKNRDKHKIRLLLKSLARNESNTVSLSTIQKDIKEVDFEDIDTDTVASYLNALDKLFLLDNDEPYNVNVRSSIRVKQSPKRHFCDPSIACALLDLTVEKLIRDLNTFGFLFEAMVIRDLKIYASTMDAKCYHYQDYANKEIDAVIELKDGSWCCFEIKLGENRVEEAAKNLVEIKESIAKENGKVPKILCVICGLATTTYQRSDGVYVVPITALKS